MTTPEAKNAREFAARVAAPYVGTGMFFIRDTANGKLYADNGKWTTDRNTAGKYGPRAYAEEVRAAIAGGKTLELVEV